MSSRSGVFCLLFFAASLLLPAAPSRAQSIRYLGRAVGEIATDNVFDEAHADGDPADADDHVFCDETVSCCFDEPNGCGAATPTGSRTRGGAGLEVDGTEGFPRSESRVGAISLALEENIISLSGVQAIADSDGDANGDDVQDGGLSTSCGVLTVTVEETVTTIIPELNIPIPVTDGVIARCTRQTVIEDGLSSIEIDVVLVEPAPGETQFLRANALAGVELPFTTGGACAVGNTATDIDLGVSGVLGLLWMIARRRRKGTHLTQAAS